MNPTITPMNPAAISTSRCGGPSAGSADGPSGRPRPRIGAAQADTFERRPIGPGMTSATQKRPRMPQSFADRLSAAHAALEIHAARVNRDPRFAGPHRDAIWDAAKLLLDARPKGSEGAAVRAPMQALRAFDAEFRPYQHSGDQHLQARIFAGYSRARPGLLRLVEEVLVAAGLERPQPRDTDAGF